MQDRGGIRTMGPDAIGQVKNKKAAPRKAVVPGAPECFERWVEAERRIDIGDGSPIEAFKPALILDWSRWRQIVGQAKARGIGLLTRPEGWEPDKRFRREIRADEVG